MLKTLKMLLAGIPGSKNAQNEPQKILRFKAPKTIAFLS
jgi:hypothetical protein